MEVYLNGQREKVNPGETVRELLSRKGLGNAKVVLVYNSRVLLEEEWGELLEDEAVIEVLSFVGGG
ncbi:MAG TPA: sulfur carrier protein ThiS [Firmicutes bacterium]|nr:sulfur carrier protein ThiS [Bacillota bacterium]